MAGLLKGLMDRFERRRVQEMLDILPVWYNTCLRVSEICGEALQDTDLVQGDIGVVLDKADRMLFQFRNDAGDVRRAVRRYDQQLALRVETMTRQVFELRNATAKFLIRAQGPSPFAKGGTDRGASEIYYHRALEESGYQARKIKTELDKDIQLLWADLEKLMRLTAVRIRS